MKKLVLLCSLFYVITGMAQTQIEIAGSPEITVCHVPNITLKDQYPGGNENFIASLKKEISKKSLRKIDRHN